MSVRSLARLYIYVLLLSIIVSNQSAIAQERELKSSASEKVDAVLVLDSSGSMLVTDPLKLREEGAKLFSQFLKTGDRLSIVSFAETAKVVREIKDYDSSQADSVSKDIAGIQSTGQYTNILEGVRLAKTILENNPRDGATPTIILLSDGKMEPAPGSGSGDMLSQQLAEIILPELKKSGVKVYTLAFSEQVDKALLQEISALTDGINWFTPTADKIHESFANLFLAVKKPQVVPLTKKGFKIDADVQEATFYINREDAQGEIGLTKPDGTLIKAGTTDPSIKWFNGQKFDVVTITAPTPGDWQLSGITTNDGFATVLTNLKLITDWPSNIFSGDKALLEARLYEAEKPIALPEMSGVIKYAYQITPTDKVSEPIVRDFLHDDGTHGDKIARDGIFSSEIEIEEAGEYRLRVLAKAPTFERNQQLPFRIKPPLVSISVGEAELMAHSEAEHGHDAKKDDHGHGDTHAAANDGGAPGEAIIVKLSEEAASYRKINVKLMAIDEKKTRYEIPLTVSNESKLKYFASVKLLPADGQYKLQATLTAEAKRGSEIRSQTKVISYNRVTVEHAHEDEVKVVVEKKEVKEKPPSAVIPIILATLLNGGLAAAGFFYLKKLKGVEDTNATEFESTEPFEKLLDLLAAKFALSDVDLSSPVFVDAEYFAPALWQGGTTSAQPQSTPAKKQSDSEEVSPEESESTEEVAEEGDVASESEEPTSEEEQE